MDIRQLLRLARQRWPEPEGKNHYITLNTPNKDREEDWLTFGVWAEGRLWYFYITRESVEPEKYLDGVDKLIRGAIRAERKTTEQKALDSIQRRPLTEPMKAVLLTLLGEPNTWKDADQLHATGATLTGLYGRGLVHRNKRYGGWTDYALTPEGHVVALVLQKERENA